MIINYVVDNSDEFVIDGQDKLINFADDSSFSFTFWNNKTKMPKWYSHQGVDLLYISLAVFAADRLTLRHSAADGWSRTFELHIPVLELNRWEENCNLLEEMINFLSGDFWRFKFRQRELSTREIMHNEITEKSKILAKEYDKVCMFSGGLDSFVGAIDVLESNVGNVLFISHYGGGKGTKEYQDLLRDNLITMYDAEPRDFFQFYAKTAAGIEDTTRTRSFMFFAHAIAVASALGKPVDLIIPENGLISLNIPLTFSRFGTSSTRTTHPYYFKLLQKLIYNLGIEVTIMNPYQFFTKGEMLINCKNQEFLKSNLVNTMSCSHPDNGRMLRETKARHCGYCLPCVIRQAAIKKATMEDGSFYYDNKFTLGDTSKISLNSYRLGMEKFEPKFAFMSIQKSGSLSDNIDEFRNLYIRGMDEVKIYLEEI